MASKKEPAQVFDKEIVLVTNLWYRHSKNYRLNSIETSDEKNMEIWASKTTVKKLGEKVKKLLNYDLHQIVLETSPCNYGKFNMQEHGDKTLAELSSQIKTVDKEESGETQVVKLYILPGKPVRDLNIFKQILLALFVLIWCPIAMVLRTVLSIAWAPQYFLCYMPTRFFHYAYAVTAKESVISMPTALTYGFYKLFTNIGLYPIRVLFECLWTPMRTIFRFLGSSNNYSGKMFVHNILGVFRDKLSFFDEPVTAEESISLTKAFVSKIHKFNNTEPTYPTGISYLSWTMFKGTGKLISRSIIYAGKCLVSRDKWMKFGSTCAFMIFELIRFALYVPLGLVIGSIWGVISFVANFIIGIPAFFKKTFKEMAGRNVAIKIIATPFLIVICVPAVILGSLASFFASNFIAVRGVRDVLLGSKSLGSTRLKSMKEGLSIMGHGFLDTVTFAYDILKE